MVERVGGGGYADADGVRGSDYAVPRTPAWRHERDGYLHRQLPLSLPRDPLEHNAGP